MNEKKKFKKKLDIFNESFERMKQNVLMYMMKNEKVMLLEAQKHFGQSGRGCLFIHFKNMKEASDAFSCSKEKIKESPVLYLETIYFPKEIANSLIQDREKFMDVYNEKTDFVVLFCINHSFDDESCFQYLSTQKLIQWSDGKQEHQTEIEEQCEKLVLLHMNRCEARSEDLYKMCKTLYEKEDRGVLLVEYSSIANANANANVNASEHTPYQYVPDGMLWEKQNEKVSKECKLYDPTNEFVTWIRIYIDKEEKVKAKGDSKVNIQTFSTSNFIDASMVIQKNQSSQLPKEFVEKYNKVLKTQTITPLTQNHPKSIIDKYQCSVCYFVGTSEQFIACSICKIPVYCSQKCQLIHWSTHKTNCKKMDNDNVGVVGVPVGDVDQKDAIKK